MMTLNNPRSSLRWPCPGTKNRYVGGALCEIFRHDKKLWKKTISVPFFAESLRLKFRTDSIPKTLGES